MTDCSRKNSTNPRWTFPPWSFENNKKIDEKLVKKYQTEEQKDPIILDKENIDINIIEDSIYEIENGSIRHDSLKTAYLIFSYLMKEK